METAAFLLMAFFGLLNLWVFHRFRRPLLPLVAALFVSFFAFFLSPIPVSYTHLTLPTILRV